ncbi:hypothetical protein N8940_00215 [Sphingomonadaceae bacterium]|nr:hypothetical protein [Sphingomonadaceae bacterium]
MLSLVFATLMLGQQGSGTATAIKPDKPTTWSLEYPYMIEPYIDDYYGCLKSRELFAGDDRSFEEQHRGAIPQCAKQEARAVKEANEKLASRGRSAETTPEDVAGYFETIRQIHIARGRDLDAQLLMRINGDPYAAQGFGPADETTVEADIEMLPEGEADPQPYDGEAEYEVPASQ